MTDNNASAKAPTSFWIVAGVSLLWNAFGGYDYWMSQTRNEAYLGQMGNVQEILAWIDRFPLWAEIGWGLGVWGSVAGSLLLLARSRHAVSAFLVSLCGAVVSFSGQLANPAPASLEAGIGKFMPFVILGIIAFLYAFARRAAGKGTLR